MNSPQSAAPRLITRAKCLCALSFAISPAHSLQSNTPDSAQSSDTQHSRPNHCRRCEMNMALNCNSPETHSSKFQPGAHQQDLRSSTGDDSICRQSYFSICAPLPDMPTGNRFPYGVCGPFLEEDEAFEALQALRAKMPKRKLAVMYGQNFFDTPHAYLENDQELARAKLAALLTAE